MVVESLSGLRCQGLYRGKVILHLPHGRLKVFVYGVYPEDYLTQPDYLPICEQITPLWGGSFNGNGSFSYPNIGSTVWILFANEDVNYPVAIGATLGGENAYNLYNLIKKLDEDISKTHMFTTGMSHFLMYEDGKISAYVQLPFDNNVSIDFSDGDVSCNISDDIAQKIENNEISHIVCQTVLDNDSNKGEISSSTHFYEPIKYAGTYLVSGEFDIETHTDNIFRETSGLVYSIKNNLGNIINGEICALTSNSSKSILQNDLLSTSIVSSDKEYSNFDNIETLTIDGKKEIKLLSILSKDLKLKLNQDIDKSYCISTYNILKKSLNKEENIKDSHNIINISNEYDLKQTYKKYNGYNGILSAINYTDKSVNKSYKKLDLSGIKDDDLENISDCTTSTLYINPNTKETITQYTIEKTKKYASDYLDNGKASDEFDSSRVLVSQYSLNDEYNYISVGEEYNLQLISTLFFNQKIEADSINTNLSCTTFINDSTELLSTLNNAISCNIISNMNAQCLLDKNTNACLDVMTNIDTISTTLDEKYLTQLSTILSNNALLSINTNNITLGSLKKYGNKLTKRGLKIKDKLSVFNENYLTSDNSLKINENNLSLLKNHYKYEAIDYILLDQFILSGSARNIINKEYSITPNVVLELSNYKDILSEDDNKRIIITQKHVKTEFDNNENEAAMKLVAQNDVTGISCLMTMSTENKQTEIVTKNIATNMETTIISKVTMDVENLLLTIYADGSKGPCVVKLNTVDGEILVEAAKIINISADSEVNINTSNKVKIKTSNTVDIETTKLNINASGGINVTGMTTFNSTVVFNNGTTTNNNVVVNGNINATGNVYARTVYGPGILD